MMVFPRNIEKVKAPPLKIQGIKTKLVNFIASNIRWSGKGRWIEPFLGSGVVLFNLQPQRAVVADTNKHIINFYNNIQSGKLNAISLRVYLQKEGDKLKKIGEEYYYEVRERFNNTGCSYDFVFLNRASFNGMMRFNRKGGFNVPFCRKVERFRPAYITRICNQVAWVERIMEEKEWVFLVQDWRDTLKDVQEDDFVYLDPPYIGRHADYFNSWEEMDADELAQKIKILPCGFAYSMWKENIYRVNDHLVKHFSGYPCFSFEHFYHVGATENLRNSVQEALIVAPGYEAAGSFKGLESPNRQLSLI